MWSIKDFFCNNRTLIMGTVIGLLIGVMFLTLGFFPTILLVVLGGLGAIIGGIEDVRNLFKAWINHLFSKMTGK